MSFNTSALTFNGSPPTRYLSNSLLQNSFPFFLANGQELSGVLVGFGEVNGAGFYVNNAFWNGTGWQQLNSALPSSAIQLQGTQVVLLTAPANAPNPIVWTTQQLSASFASGTYIEAFLLGTDNPSSPTFDWGVVFNRAVAGLGPNSTLLFQARKKYTFGTPGIMTGTGFNVYGAGIYSTQLQALGNNDVLQCDTNWQKSVLANLTILGQTGAVPSAGAGITLQQPNDVYLEQLFISGTYNGLNVPAGFQTIRCQNVRVIQYINNGFYVASAATGTSNAILLYECNAKPGTAIGSGGNTLSSSSGYVFDGNIATITLIDCGSVGNASDAASYGDTYRVQNSTANPSGSSLINFINCISDHGAGCGFNLGNYTSGLSGTGIAPGSPIGTAGLGTLSGIKIFNCNAGTSQYGLYLDNCGTVQCGNNTWSQNQNPVTWGTNATQINVNGDVCKHDTSVTQNLYVWPNMVGANWTGGRLGDVSGASTSTGKAVVINAGADYLNFNNVSMRGFSAPVTNSSAATHIKFTNCPGYNPQVGATSTPAFPATTVTYTNTNVYDELINVTNGAASMSVVIGVPSGSVGSSATYTIPASVPMSFILQPGGTFTPTYASGSPSWLIVGL